MKKIKFDIIYLKPKNMAKKQSSTQSISAHREKPKKKHPGIHAKTKTSLNKKSAQYKKKYRGQGR